jgi:hypothetical protein
VKRPKLPKGWKARTVPERGRFGYSNKQLYTGPHDDEAPTPVVTVSPKGEHVFVSEASLDDAIAVLAFHKDSIA